MFMNKLNVISAIIISPIISMLKSSNAPVLGKRDLLLKCYSEGLYHITTEENLSKILKAGYIKPSSFFDSYGSKKVFMFSGIPSFEEVCSNIGGKSKLVAIKINPSYEQLSEFLYRDKNDKAITYNGNLSLNDKQIEIAYLGLYKNNDKLEYKKINKDTYDNYKPNFNDSWMKNRLVRHLKVLEINMLKEYSDTINYFKNISINESKSK